MEDDTRSRHLDDELAACEAECERRDDEIKRLRAALERLANMPDLTLFRADVAALKAAARAALAGTEVTQ